MPGVQALGVFCEDIREEQASKNTLVGVLPDNLDIPQLPAMIPKLCLYVRIAFDPHIDALPTTVWLISQKGEEQQMNVIPPELISATQASVRKSGAPVATIINRLIMAGFGVLEYGRMKAVVRVGDEEIICASLNFQPSPVPKSSLSTTQRPPAKRSRGASTKKAKKRAPSRS